MLDLSQQTLLLQPYDTVQPFTTKSRTEVQLSFLKSVFKFLPHPKSKTRTRSDNGMTAYQIPSAP